MGDQVLLVVAGSSRVRDFNNLSTQNEHLYQTLILPNPGAGYINIATDVVNKLRDIDQKTLVIVYLIGGLCDITEKAYHCVKSIFKHEC